MFGEERRRGNHTHQRRCLRTWAWAQAAGATGMPGVVRARRCRVPGRVPGAARGLWLSVLCAVSGCGWGLRGSPSLEHGRVSRGYQLAQQHDHGDRPRSRKSRHGRIMARMQLPGS